MLTSDQVPEPVGVKYGFRNYQPLNLFSNFGLRLLLLLQNNFIIYETRK